MADATIMDPGEVEVEKSKSANRTGGIRIITVRAGLDGYCESQGNDERLVALDRTLEVAASRGEEAVFFPGGYLFAESRDDFYTLVDKVNLLACRSNRTASLSLGIDCEPKDHKLRDANEEAWLNARIAHGTLPWYQVHIEPTTGRVRWWRQRSVTSKNAALASASGCARKRTIIVGSGGAEIETALCGEIFNPRIRRAVLSRRTTSIAWVALVHTAYQFRFIKTFENMSLRGMNCLMSAHAIDQNAVSVAYFADGIRMAPAWTHEIHGIPDVSLREWIL